MKGGNAVSVVGGVLARGAWAGQMRGNAGFPAKTQREEIGGCAARCRSLCLGLLFLLHFSVKFLWVSQQMPHRVCYTMCMIKKAHRMSG